MTKEIEDSWTEFLQGLGDSHAESLKGLSFKLEELFDKQVHIDRAKKELFKPELNRVLKGYILSLGPVALEEKMLKNKDIFVRGFGRDRFNHLKLLVRLKNLAQDKKPRRGLLAV